MIYPENDTLIRGKYKLLNGIYRTAFENGNTRSELTTSAGYMTGFKFYYPTGELNYEIIISKQCGAPYQHCIVGYNLDGTVKYENYTFVPKPRDHLEELK